MCNSALSSSTHWPIRELPRDVFQHFVVTRWGVQEPDFFWLETREGFINALKTNLEFAQFWNQLCEEQPDNKQITASLLDPEALFNVRWIMDEFLQWKEFQSLSEGERIQLETEFEDLRKDAWREALEGEARRIGWESVHLLKESFDEVSQSCADQFRIFRLPEEIFAKILPYLESVDVFRLTLVCQKWKRIVYSYSAVLKRAEHAVTTHLISNREWMKNSWNMSPVEYKAQYCLFSRGLIKWYSGLAPNLETLILDHPYHYSELKDILQNCPNLKNLHLGRNTETQNHTRDQTSVFLPKLKALILPRQLEPQVESLKTEILQTASNLETFRTAMMCDFDLSNHNKKTLLIERISRLTALDLTVFAPENLAVIARLRGLELKYLRLGFYCVKSNLTSVVQMQLEAQNNFHELLSKQSNLEVLITTPVTGITDETMHLLMHSNPKLKTAVLCQTCIKTRRNGARIEDSRQCWNFTPLTVEKLHSVLLERDRCFDFRNFTLVVKDKVLEASLKRLNLGFEIRALHDEDVDYSSVFGLDDPVIRRQLKLAF